MTRKLFALALCGLTVAGCTATVDGTARTAGRSSGIIGVGRNIPQVLPDTTDFVAALGTSVSDRGFPPTVGLLDSLPDGIRTSSDASEIQCLGVTSPFMKKVYENSPVRAVAYYSWDKWDLGLSGHFMVRAGAVALTSPPDARALFDTFVKQWKQCQGTTMVLYQAGGGADQLHEMTNIRATDTMLSAIVMSSSPATHTAASPDERALGIAMNCIVDVEVSDSSWRTGDPMPENRAVKIAEAMLERISTTG